MKFYKVVDDGSASGTARKAVVAQQAPAKALRRDWAGNRHGGGVEVTKVVTEAGKDGVLKSINELLGWEGGKVPGLQPPRARTAKAKPAKKKGKGK